MAGAARRAGLLPVRDEAAAAQGQGRQDGGDHPGPVRAIPFRHRVPRSGGARRGGRGGQHPGEGRREAGDGDRRQGIAPAQDEAVAQRRGDEPEHLEGMDQEGRPGQRPRRHAARPQGLEPGEHRHEAGGDGEGPAGPAAPGGVPRHLLRQVGVPDDQRLHEVHVGPEPEEHDEGDEPPPAGHHPAPADGLGLLPGQQDRRREGEPAPGGHEQEAEQRRIEPGIEGGHHVDGEEGADHRVQGHRRHGPALARLVVGPGEAQAQEGPGREVEDAPGQEERRGEPDRGQRRPRRAVHPGVERQARRQHGQADQAGGGHQPHQPAQGGEHLHPAALPDLAAEPLGHHRHGQGAHGQRQQHEPRGEAGAGGGARPPGEDRQGQGREADDGQEEGAPHRLASRAARSASGRDATGTSWLVCRART